jgi:hypothetical protein
MRNIFNIILFTSVFFGSTITVIAQKTVSLVQIMEDRDTTTPNKKKPRYCDGGRFKPCVCYKDVTKRIMYRPSVKECNGNAGIILHGGYSGAFSAVVRNKENTDRVPANELINGCSTEDRDILALSKCSVYKAQKVIKTYDYRGNVTLHCLGAKGNSNYFKRVSRITVKIADKPGTTDDPIARVCLKSPTENLN